MKRAILKVGILGMLYKLLKRKEKEYSFKEGIRGRPLRDWKIVDTSEPESHYVDPDREVGHERLEKR